MNSSLQNHGQVQSLFARAVGRIGFTTTPGFHMIGDCRGLWVVFKHLFWGTQLISGLSFAIFEGRAIPCYHTTWGLCPGSSPSEWLREDEHWDFDHNFVWIQWASGNFWMICWDVIQQQVGTDSRQWITVPMTMAWGYRRSKFCDNFGGRPVTVVVDNWTLGTLVLVMWERFSETNKGGETKTTMWKFTKAPRFRI